MASQEYLATRLAANAESPQKSNWAELSDLYERRLWYQVSVKLGEVLRSSDFIQSAGGYGELYRRFVQDLESRIGAYKLAETATFLSPRIFPDNLDEQIAFLEGTRKKLKNDVAADCIVLTAIGTATLKKGNVAAVKTLLEETEKKLRGIDNVSLAHPQFYELSSEFYRLHGTYAEYFREALKYLGCVDLEKLSSEEKRGQAERLAIAAILGDDIYSFGELLVHPIIQALQNPKYEWLLKSLEAFNYGDQKAFEALKAQWLRQIPESTKLQPQMTEKLQLMGIVEMGFKRPPHERDLTFKEIAATSNVPVDQVEMLLMRALSLKLIRGDIDEKAQTFYMTWVKPRVLNMEQITKLTKNLKDWCNDVDVMERLIQLRGHEMLAAV
ncbi:26S proteasome non-ATPase regulatory subunit 13-like isoform X2 [Paramacrobiotus metropolitanus]|uniref:26S proteasome non-ATPase regulatory subunit 13-like isoform X2 n=1 Tax=Paramacrobiotus metropolitanus TaxID=2943436 RepID=UPI002445B35E|nr:26S proteasome non-ATPase regulatory subunit 13-like isoform X2 [Paramacrobiotus metropolitanus]